jgi:hypothetical protein
MIILLQNVFDCKYSFQKLTQFSQGNNVQDPPASNKLFSYKTYIVSSIHLNGAVLLKGDIPYTWKPWDIGSVPFKR